MKVEVHLFPCGTEVEERFYRPTDKKLKEYMKKNWMKYENKREVVRAAIDLFIVKYYGKRCFFWRDYGLREMGFYGQICEPCMEGGNNCKTPRIRFDVSIDGKDQG